MIEFGYVLNLSSYTCLFSFDNANGETGENRENQGISGEWRPERGTFWHTEVCQERR
jgi:hypothetical protein